MDDLNHFSENHLSHVKNKLWPDDKLSYLYSLMFMGRNGDTIHAFTRASTLHPYARPRQTSSATIFIHGTAPVPSSLPLCAVYCGEFNVFTSCSNIYCHCECETIESALRPPHFLQENECNVFNICQLEWLRIIYLSRHVGIVLSVCARRSAHTYARMRFGRRQNSFETVIMICVCCVCVSTLEGKGDSI